MGAQQQVFWETQAAANEAFYFQDLSLNVHFYLDVFRHWRSSSFEKHWWYRHAALPRAIGSKIYIFYLVYKACMNLNGTEWLVEMDWKKRSSKKDRNFFWIVLKAWQKKTCGRAAFLETLHAAILSLHKKVNSSRKVLQTCSEICIFCVMQQTWSSHWTVLLKTVLDEVYFIINLYGFLPLVSQANPSIPKISYLPPPTQKIF